MTTIVTVCPSFHQSAVVFLENLRQHTLRDIESGLSQKKVTICIIMDIHLFEFKPSIIVETNAVYSHYTIAFKFKMNIFYVLFTHRM